jgi:hypothetical protein
MIDNGRPRYVRMGKRTLTVHGDLFGDVELARDDLLGQSDIEQLTIRVRTDVDRDVQEETIIHELLHHAWHMTALPDLLEDQEEAVIRSLAPWLAEVLRIRWYDAD